MSALDDLRNKPYSQRNKIERCIVLLWDGPTGYEYLAEEAAEELATMMAAKSLTCPECDGAIEFCAMGHYLPQPPAAE